MRCSNVRPVLAELMVTVAFLPWAFCILAGAVAAPGLASYCNAFLFNRIFDKYGMTLE